MDRLLIVDDDAAHLDAVAEILGRDFDVVAVHSGEEAWALVQSLDDLILTPSLRSR